MLEEGYVAHLQPVIAEIYRAPWGVVSRKVELYCSDSQEQALINLFSLNIQRRRDRVKQRERDDIGERVRAAIAQSGPTPFGVS